ncbi:MAG: efflux RND transporter periplasmic adaptor subunit [Muribaculaceae bacterium]|nr:efflux RND transporter periplasmic adaptor subunit [Muribaculaceae bacterium]
MKNKEAMKNFYIFMLGLTFLAAAGCKHGEDKNGLRSEIPDIDVAEATTDSITLYKTYPGTLSAGVTADVVAEVSGRILSTHYRSGDYVRKGQSLFTIESTTYRDAVSKAEAALSTARSQHEYYTRQYAAMTKAFEADAVSQMEVLQAKSNMEQAAASIRDAEAALSTARQNLSRCNVVAPISGYISNGAPDPGNYVNGQGAPVKLCTIYDNSTMTANFYLSDTQYEELLGRNGGISSAIYRNVPLNFKERIGNDYTTDLYYVAPTVSESTGTLLLKGKLENRNNELKDGMYVTVSLPYGTEPKAVLVKDASIGSDQLGKYMYIVNDSNKVVYTPVEVGSVYQDSLRVITSGVKPGQKYVTKALLTVQRGERINPVITK